MILLMIWSLLGQKQKGGSQIWGSGNSRTPLTSRWRQMEAEKENNENSLLDDWSETKRKKLKKGGERVGVETDRQKGAEETRTRLWLCLNSTAVCQQYNCRICRGTESLLFIPMRLKSDGFSITLSLSQMARHQTFLLQPSCTRLSTA